MLLELGAEREVYRLVALVSSFIRTRSELGLDLFGFETRRNLRWGMGDCMQTSIGLPALSDIESR